MLVPLTADLRGAIGFALLVALGATGCRGCGESSSSRSGESRGPTMPTGLLSPLGDAVPAPASGATPAERLTLATNKKEGEWVELQVAGAGEPPDRRSFDRWRADSRFLSLDAIGVLHDPLARALPGFDLFLPRLYDPAALGRLRVELEDLKSEVNGIVTVRRAMARFPGSTAIRELPDDAAWSAARAALLTTLDALVAIATDLEKTGRALWVIGT